MLQVHGTIFMMQKSFYSGVGYGRGWDEGEGMAISEDSAFWLINN